MGIERRAAMRLFVRLPKAEADAIRDKVLALHRAGKKNFEIARELKLHKNSVWGYLERAGVALIRPKRMPLKRKKHKGKHIEWRTCTTCGKQKPVSAFGNKYNHNCSLCYKNGAVD